MLVLGDILRRHAAVRGDKTAYVIGSERPTYRAFHARSNQVARALARLGVGRGDRVAVLAPNRVEYPILYFAVVKLGAIVVPLNARFTAPEVARIVTHAEAETLVVAGEHAPLVAMLREEGGLSCVRRFVAMDAEAAPWAQSLAAVADAESEDDVEVVIDERDPHVMLYTSGTTGSPKGTLLSHCTSSSASRRTTSGSACSRCSTWAAGRCPSASGTPARRSCSCRRRSRAPFWRRSRASG
jgi:acyl-CoA synthetase (AMP-forming)/AMP-acid ligase II